MPDKHSSTDVIKNLGDAVLNGIIEGWVLITIGLLGLLGLFGKRMLNKFDAVVESHMPSAAIDKKIAQVYVDMKSCQKDLREDSSELKSSVSELHGRVDDIYHILIGDNSSRPARKEDRE